MVTLITVLAVLVVYFVLAVWAFRRGKTDKLSKDQVIVLPDNDPFDKACYLVTVYTGSRFGAGTTADVFITLIGNIGQSDVHLLKHPTAPALYRGGVNTFLLTAKTQLGDLISIRLWHNNSGFSPEWFLSRVKVENMYTKQVWYFMCRKWFSTTKDDQLLDRTFSVTSLSAPLSKRDFFEINLTFSLEESHLWFSVFSHVVTGPFSRLQRLSCCLAMLMSSLLTSIVLFQNEKIDEDNWDLWYVRPMMVGIECALVTVPVQLLVSALFTYTQQEQDVTYHSPYHQISEYQSNEANRSATHLFFWMSYVQPRDWKERLQRWYRAESSDESEEINSKVNKMQISDLQSDQPSHDSNYTVPNSFKHRRTHFSCAVPEYLMDTITTYSDHKIAAWTTVYHNKSTVSQLTSQEHFAQLEKINEKGNSPPNIEKMILTCKSKIVLSWWCIYFAWGTVIIVTIVSSFFIILYGLSYGRKTSLTWLFAAAFSFVQSIFAVQPVKIALFSGVFSITDNTCRSLSWATRYNLLEISLDEAPRNTDEMRELHYKLIKLRKSKAYQPLDKDELTIAKKRDSIKTKASVYLKCIISHLIFLFLVIYLASFHGNINYFYHNRIVYHQLSSSLFNVKEIDSIYTWINETFLPLIHNEENPTFLKESHAKILGLPRMRQVRAKKEKINCFREDSFVYLSKLGKANCHPKYGQDEEDQDNYDHSWQNIDKTSTGSNITIYTGYVYEQNILPWIYFSPGELHYYPPGGYTVYFSPEDLLSNSVERLNDLLSSTWIDEYTWAVILDLTTFNPDADLFCAVSVIFEVSPLGVILKTLSVNSFPLPVFERKDTKSISNDIICACILMLFVIDEVHTILKEKEKYINKTANLVNLCLRSLLLLILILEIVTFKLASDLLNFYLLHPTLFIPFYIVSVVHQALRITIAILLFFTILKTMIYAKFFYNVRLAQKSITAALPSICSMTLVIGIYIFVYMMFGYLVFGQYEWNYSNMIHAAQTIVSYCASVFNNINFTSNKFLGGIYLASFVLIMTCALINLFQVVILSHYEGMKQPVYEEASDEAEVAAFLFHKSRHIWNSIWSKKYIESEPEILSPVLYGQGEDGTEESLGLKARNIDGQKLIYLLI